MQIKRLLGALLAISGAYLIPTPARAEADPTDAPEYWKPAQQELARLGDGFLVWESKRTGPWRLWTIRLDGTGLHQLSADEPDRDHLCPKISPDGKKVVYLSCAKDTASWGGGDTQTNQPLHLINLETKEDKIIVPQAFKYAGGWDRAITWFNNDELAYISAEDGDTYQLDLRTGKSTRLIKRVSAGSPSWLPNSRKTSAVWAFNTFSPYDPASQMVNPSPHLGGCMPYFTQDGQWGFWESAMGGPIGIYRISSGIVSHSLGREMMPSPHRDYIYFPMVSADNRLMAVGAAPHDKLVGGYGGYVESDYEIFVAPLDPKNLRVIGRPIRYTFEPHCDRFPDVWQAPMPLGFQSDKAPYTADFPIAMNRTVMSDWDYGDGTKEQAVFGKHTYTKPGLYTVEARRPNSSLIGQVYVAPTSTPHAVQATLKTEREVVVAFDEPVETKAMTVAMASGGKIEKWTPGADGYSLHLALAGRPKDGDALLLDGIFDRAQKPNPMGPARLPLEVRIWPSNPEGIVFLWSTSDKPSQLRDPATGKPDRCQVVPHGAVWYDHNRAMSLRGGVVAVEGLTDQFSRAAAQTNSFTIELTVTPFDTDSDVLQCILSAGVYCRKGALLLRADGKEVEIGRVSANNTSHIIITGTPAGLCCYRDGDLVSKAGLPPILPHQLPTSTLTIGGDPDGHLFRGTVEGIALYARAFSAEEAKVNAKARTALASARTPVESSGTWAAVAAQSKLPDLKQISPYTRALAVNEYNVPIGNGKTKKLRAAHWVLLDRQYTRIAQICPRGDTELYMEPFTANPQLEGEFLCDTLEPNPDLPLYFCPDVRRVTRGGTPCWNLAGPFTLADAKNLAAPTDIEGLTTPDKTYAPKAGQQWKRVSLAPLGDGYIDLHDTFGTSGNCAYALVYIKEPTNRPALLNINSECPVKAWVNGKVVLTAQPDRFPLRSQYRQPIETTNGWNEVLLKVIRTGEFWGFNADVLSADGRETGDIQFTPVLGQQPMNCF